MMSEDYISKILAGTAKIVAILDEQKGEEGNVFDDDDQQKIIKVVQIILGLPTDD